MSRIVVNPGAPQSWEIQLKPGVNSLGRGAHNDFQINDASVSGSHCQILLNDGTASIKDLGSTNGTFLNHAQIQEAALANGQTIRLGSVEMLFSSDGQREGSTSQTASSGVGQERTAAPAAAAPIPVVRTVSSSRPVGLRLTGHAAAPPAVAVDEPPVAPPVQHELPSGPRICKFHPASPARHLCPKCNRMFCDLCVASRPSGGVTIKLCRTCGVECLPLEAESFVTLDDRGFFRQLPGAFLYPLKGSGILILIFATILFAALSFMSAGWLGILMKMAALGYLFSYMQNIIYATAAEEKELPSVPDFDGLFGAFFTLVGTVLMSFGLALGLAFAKFIADVEAIPTAAVIVAVIFGCLYFPMAFLATAMKDTALAANPLIVIPAILKVPLEYLVTVILLGGIFGVQQVGDIISSGAGAVSFTTTSAAVLLGAFGFQLVWSFFSVYLLTLNTRILGLLYVTKKDKLQWF